MQCYLTLFACAEAPGLDGQTVYAYVSCGYACIIFGHCIKTSLYLIQQTEHGG